jgi:hypothetical protein
LQVDVGGTARDHALEQVGHAEATGRGLAHGATDFGNGSLGRRVMVQSSRRGVPSL